MQVVHLRADDNCIELANQRYMVTRDSAGACHTIKGKCPHRGGPLHLGQLDQSAKYVVCPWHKSKTSLTWLLAGELPTVNTRDRISVVVGDGSSGTAHALHRTMLLDCAAALAEAKGRSKGATA